MSIDVSAQLEMPFPSEQIAAVMFDPAYDSRWMKAVKQSERLDDKSGPGARVRRSASFLGRRTSWVMEVIEHDPLRLLRLKTTNDPLAGVTYEITPVGDGSLVRIRYEYNFGRFGWLPGIYLRVLMKPALRSDLKRLRDEVARRA